MLTDARYLEWTSYLVQRYTDKLDVSLSLTLVIFMNESALSSDFADGIYPLHALFLLLSALHFRGQGSLIPFTSDFSMCQTDFYILWTSLLEHVIGLHSMLVTGCSYS